MNTSYLARRSNRLIIYVIVTIITFSFVTAFMGEMIGTDPYASGAGVAVMFACVAVIFIVFQYYEWTLNFRPYRDVLQEIADEKDGKLKKTLSSITMTADNLELFYFNGELAITYKTKGHPDTRIERTGSNEWKIELSIDDQPKHDEYYIRVLNTLKKAKLMRFYIKLIMIYESEVYIKLENFELDSKKIIRFIKYMQTQLRA